MCIRDRFLYISIVIFQLEFSSWRKLLGSSEKINTFPSHVSYAEIFRSSIVVLLLAYILLSYLPKTADTYDYLQPQILLFDYIHNFPENHEKDKYVFCAINYVLLDFMACVYTAHPHT